MPQPAYLRYESGERTPSIHVIYFMANILGTSAEYLIGKTDTPSPTGHWVNAGTESELFSFIETYNSSDAHGKEMLLAYVSKIKHL